MNKKEISEVKKQFKINNNICGLNKVLTSYIDSEKNTKFIETRSFLNLPEIEVLMFMELFKKTLSGGVGKNLLEFCFPYDNQESEDKLFLVEVKDSKFEDDDINERFVKKIVDNFEYMGDYYIVSINCSYSIPLKNKNNDSDGEDSLEVYDFILTSICPVVKVERGLCFDKEKNTIEKSYETQLEVSKPMHGFLFPTFNDRTADIHNILYYTAKPSEPSQSNCKYS